MKHYRNRFRRRESTKSSSARMFSAKTSLNPSNQPSLADSSAGARDLDRYERLYNLIVRLAKTDSLEEALGEILDTAMDLVHADAGYIRLVEPGNETIPFVASRGFPESYIEYFGSLVQPVSPRNRALILGGQRTSIEDVFAHPPFQPHLEQVIAAGHKSNHMLPFMSRGPTALGGICVAFIERHTPTEDEFRTLELYARIAADTIEKHEHRERQARMQEELTDAIAVKDKFLGLVSHELRTPMTVLRGLASVLVRNPDLEAETRHEVYDDLAFESERLYRLIENMLTVAKVNAGKAPSVEPVALDRVLLSSAEALRRQIPGLELVAEVRTMGILVTGIEQHIEQILDNLVRNAHKYSPRGSLIEITAASTGDMVRISVADRGVGLKDTVSLFQPFERGNGAAERAPGLGLGLAVCKTLVEAQGGHIWAEARNGGGSTFHFTLPVIPDPLDD